MMAMCNLKDGGVIVVGMKEDPKGVWEPVGLTDAQATSFAQDDIAQWVNDYAIPAVQFTVSRLAHDGKAFVAIQVREFDSIPTICRKQMTLRGQDVLRRGAIYYRSNSKNESAPISSEEDVRELVTLATMKAVGKEIARLRELGLVATPPAPHEDSALKYQQEREGR
jgi:predicted HTH transcriptional regulator